MLANVTMNMGGLASGVEGSPFENWSIILFPYATGDFHAGTGEFHYTDKDGREKILYHNGYVNYTQTMQKVMEPAGIKNPEAVVVTGYSAGDLPRHFFLTIFLQIIFQMRKAKMS